MDDLMQTLNEHILPHWAFFSWFIIAMMIGQVMKSALWTKKNARDNKPHWFWWWGYKTMALHPVLAGVLIGLLWRHPEAAVDGMPASLAYFALSGALSTWGYEFLKGFVKKKTGLDLDIPGVTPSSPPPEK